MSTRKRWKVVLRPMDITYNVNSKLAAYRKVVEYRERALRGDTFVASISVFEDDALYERIQMPAPEVGGLQLENPLS